MSPYTTPTHSYVTLLYPYIIWQEFQLVAGRRLSCVSFSLRKDIRGLPTTRCTLLKVLIIRSIVCWGLYWGTTIYGNCHFTGKLLYFTFPEALQVVRAPIFIAKLYGLVRSLLPKMLQDKAGCRTGFELGIGA